MAPEFFDFDSLVLEVSDFDSLAFHEVSRHFWIHPQGWFLEILLLFDFDVYGWQTTQLAELLAKDQSSSTWQMGGL